MRARQRCEVLTYTPLDVAFSLKQKIDWVLAAQASPHAELRTSVGFGHQLGFVAESISITEEEEAPRILESMTEMPTLEPCDVTVGGTKLIQAIESIARGRDLLTIRW